MNLEKKSVPILIIMTLINSVIFINYYQDNKLMHGIGYFLFFYIAIFLIKIVTNKYNSDTIIEVKNPKAEFKIVFLFAVLGLLFIAINFYLKYKFSGLGLLLKLPVILGMFFFTIPVGILIYFLRKKYKILDLGLRAKPIHILLGVVVWALTGAFAYIFNYEGILRTAGLKEFGGFGGLLLEGLIGAALVEEFARFAFQTRLENRFVWSGFQILLASIVWSLMHFPVTYFKSRVIGDTLIYCLQIIPLGFVWGYLTHKTKSILLSVFAHGLNLWGLQNG